MGKGSSDVGIGYYYHLSMHMVLCAGPIDYISRIKSGDHLLWGQVLGSSGTSPDPDAWVWIPDNGYSGPVTHAVVFPSSKKAGLPDVQYSRLAENSGSFSAELGTVANLNPTDAQWFQSFITSFNEATGQAKPAASTSGTSGEPTETIELASTLSVTNFVNNSVWSAQNLTANNLAAQAYPATNGRVSYNGRIVINRMDIYGGKKKEGGFSGTVRVLYGKPDQTQDAFLQAKTNTTGTPTDIPAFRGVTSLVWEDCYYGANAVRPKAWAVEATRIPKRDWITEGTGLSKIDYGLIVNSSSQGEHANPAHIIAECITNADWGLGYAESNLNLTAFTKAAKTLYVEKFGMSVIWNTISSVEEFINMVLQHINATLFVDPRTNQFTLKLIRNDYGSKLSDYTALPQFDERNIVEVKNYSRTGMSDLVNQVTVQWVDAITNKWQSMTRSNSALREAQGTIISIVKQYPGIATRSLASQVLDRDISVLSQPLASVSLTVNRDGASILPGDVIKWKWNDLGIGSHAVYPFTEAVPDDGMILRVSSVNYGTLTDGKIILECIEDIYGADHVKFVTPSDTSPTDSGFNPSATVPSAHVTAINATYVDMYLGAIKAKYDITQLTPHVGAFVPLASPPGTNTTTYQLSAAPDGTDPKYTLIEKKHFLPYAELSTALTPYLSTGANQTNVYHTVHFQVKNGVQLESVVKDNSQFYIIVGDEMMELLSIKKDTVASGQPQTWSLLCSRGVIDTVPTWHNASTPVYFYSQLGSAAFATYHDGQHLPISVQVAYKVQTISPTGDILSLGNANKYTVSIDDRWYRPYPPGNINITGTPAEGGQVGHSTPWFSRTPLVGNITIYWDERNRVSQEDKLVRQDEGPVAGEKGLTYTVRILDAVGTVKRTIEWIKADPNVHVGSFVYTSAMATDDGLNASDSAFYFSIFAVRHEILDFDEEYAFASTYSQIIPIARSAAGYNQLTGLKDTTYTPTTSHLINDVQITNFRVSRGKNIDVSGTTEGRFEGSGVTILWDTNVDEILKDPSKAKIDKSNLVDKYEVKIFIDDPQIDPFDLSTDHSLSLSTVSKDLLTQNGVTIDLAADSHAFYIAANGTDGQSFTCSYKLNEALGGAKRRMVFRVRAHTGNGRYSAGFIYKVENPAPVFGTLLPTAHENGLIEVLIPKTSDLDYVGYYVYTSNSDNITGDEAATVLHKEDKLIFIDSNDQPVYFRLRIIDEFSAASSTGKELSTLTATYKVNKIDSLEQFSNKVFNSPGYKYLVTPLKELFSIDTIKNLANSEIARLNSAADAIAGSVTAVVTGTNIVKDVNTHLATAYTVIQSYLNNASTRIATEETTRAEQNKALAYSVKLMDSKVVTASNTLKASILNWYQTLVTDTSALARSITQLEASIKGAIGEVSASVHRVDLARVDERGALAAAVLDLNASVNSGTSSISSRLSKVEAAAVGYCSLDGGFRVDGIDQSSCEALSYCVIGGSTDHSKTSRTACEAAGGTWHQAVWNAGLPFAGTITQAIADAKGVILNGLPTTIHSAIQQETVTFAPDIQTLANRWAVKTTNEYTDSTTGKQYVALSGVVQDTRVHANNNTGNATPDYESDFFIMAHKFAIVPPVITSGVPNFDQPNWAAVTSSYTNDPNTNPLVPFGVDAATGTTYIKSALIHDLEAHKIRGDVSKFIADKIFPGSDAQIPTSFPSTAHARLVLPNADSVYGQFKRVFTIVTVEILQTGSDATQIANVSMSFRHTSTNVTRSVGATSMFLDTYTGYGSTPQTYTLMLTSNDSPAVLEEAIVEVRLKRQSNTANWASISIAVQGIR